MADKEAEKEEGGKKSGGWFKMILGAGGGLLSGAVAMYFGAFLDLAVKPAKPVPNFRVVHQGYTVRFENLAQGFTGWWDFGDGTELVPVSTDHDSVTHTYERPGDYTAKMSLQNLLKEESERTVVVHVEEPAPEGTPKINDLTVTAGSADSFAPAMFRVAGKVSAAKLCVWDFGDERALEVVTDPPGSQERVVTFQKPGAYTIKLAALNGARSDQKTQKVFVKEAPAGAVSILVTATDVGSEVKTQERACVFGQAWRPDVKGDVHPVSRDVAARPGWTITDLKIGAGDKPLRMGDKTDLALDAAALGFKNARNLRLQLTPDRQSVKLTGEMTRDGAAKGAAPNVVLNGTVVEQQKTPNSRAEATVTEMLTAPTGGRTVAKDIPLPPQPAGWVDVKRTLELELRDGRNLTQEAQLPCHAEITLQGRRCILNATQVKDQIHVELIDASARAGAN